MQAFMDMKYKKQYKDLLSCSNITQTKLGHSVWNRPKHGTVNFYTIL